MPTAVRPAKQGQDFSPFARGIYEQKYAFKDKDGNIVEDWPDTAKRVIQANLEAISMEETESADILEQYLAAQQFLAGGRYLYASGRDFHQTQNCLLMRCEDSREGWSELLANASMALMTGAGIGIDYSDVRQSGSVITKTGGVASGPISIMEMVNECGRHIMQGGSRRSAIWAGLNWKHGDIFQFIDAKNWSDIVRAEKEKDFNFPARLDMTNISVLLDDEFFEAHDNEDHELHNHAREVYHQTTKRMLKTAEPGFSIDVGENAGETLRNAPVTAGTNVLTRQGYQPVSDIVDNPTTVWTGKQWANDVVFSLTEKEASVVCVLISGGREIRCEPNHEFLVEEYSGAGSRRKFERILKIPAKDLESGDILHVSYPTTSGNALCKDYYTMGYIYGDGSFTNTGGADLTLCTDESKDCLEWLDGYNSVNENDSRGYTRLYFSVNEKFSGRGKAEFPKDIYAASPEQIKSFVGGLFDADGNWEPINKAIRLASKHKSFLNGVQKALEQIGIQSNISSAGTSTFGKTKCWQLVIAADFRAKFADEVPTHRLNINLDSYKPYRASTIKVLEVVEDGIEDVYCADVKVEEHSFMAEGVIISNCCEVTSADDSDICNLGSINLANIDTKEEFAEVIDKAVLFLLSGTVYSHVPYEKVKNIRTKNRRLGLGLMGIHEWLLKRQYKYAPNDELREWLEIYESASNAASEKYSKKLGLSKPVKVRAIAPTGTIGIIAETTTGIEPIYCVAMKRRYLKDGKNWVHEYIVDPTAKRLIDEDGVHPSSIESAHELAYNVEKRIEFQAFVQQYVDHAISSTINLPYPITEEEEVEDFKEMLYRYLPKLRGVTCYPDGARGGQPLTSVTYEEAIGKEGVVFESDLETCAGGVCGA